MLVHFVRCAVVAFVALLSASTNAQTITTAAPNNGSGGVFVDLTPVAGALTLDSFASYYSSAAGTPVTVEVWTRPGSYAGFTASSAGWTLTQTVSAVSSGTATLSAPTLLTSPIALPAGITTAVYFQATTTGGGIRYTGTGTTAVTMYSNADITLRSDTARVATVAFTGTAFTPRCFAGTLAYSPSNVNAMGACCSATAQCTFGSPATCLGSGGFFSGDGTSCTPNVCTHHGACCASATNACTVSSDGAAGCGSGTSYQGDASTCTPNICPQGACCNVATGGCTLTGPGGCPSGSTYQSDGTVCTPTNPCPQPPPPANDECTGALTLTLGTTATGGNVNATASATLVNDATIPWCTQATWATGAPNNQKDVFWKITAPATAVYEVDTCGSSFDTILSVHSGCPITQANLVSCNDDSTSGTGNTACTSNGLNSRIPTVTLTADTTYYFRVFGYSNATGAISITINLVGTTGSCCVGPACTLTDAANCSGTYTSGGTCSTNPCGVLGVCCRGATCNATVLAAVCTSSGTAGATFVAAAPACNASPTSNTPCCFADYNKTGGVSVQDIFDFLSDWFAGSPYAITGGNGNPGALNVQNIFDFLTAWFAGGCS